MKKILLIIVVGFLLLSGVQAVDLNEKENNKNLEITESFSFSTPIINQAGQYVNLQLKGVTNTLKDSGKPELPMVTYSIDLPFGVKNLKITYLPSEEIELDLNKKIRPTPQPVETSDVNSESSYLIEDPDVYFSNNRYPANRYDTKITCGLKSIKNRVTHISFYLYPIQYSPELNKIYYIKEGTIEITYEQPEKMQTFQDEYDMVIIGPQKFESLLQKLVNHKNNHNVKTLLKTTESIYSQYFGNDKPEQIKYFIKDAIESYNIDYVLIVGGLKSLFYAMDRDDRNQGSSAWYVPVRYTNIKKTGSLYDPGTLCDLYYADIYDGEGNFSSWDTDEDGIYAKWDNTPGRDDLDLNPDVYVGRLPCRNKKQVKTVVKKIINYDTNTPNSKSWYKRMIGISGQSHDWYSGQPDGEYLTDMGMSFVEDMIDEEVRCYASNEGTGGPLPIIKDATKAISNGARFVYFSGHGSPLTWVCHPADTMDEWMERINTKDLWRCFNFNKLPIVVVGGCHDAQFNVSLWTTLKSGDIESYRFYWTYGRPGTACFCWKLIAIPHGGAVATIGGAGLTTSLVGNPNTGNGQLATNFFYEIGQDGATSFGQAFAGSIQKYIDENVIGLWDSHLIAIWNALGDPSLKL